MIPPLLKYAIRSILPVAAASLPLLADSTIICSIAPTAESAIYQTGYLAPIDSEATLQIGEKAPDFTLPCLSGTAVSLGALLEQGPVVISFVPAAWTSVCSEQWPGYNVARPYFEESGTALIGITVDNLPTLHAWTQSMGGLWFSVLSDFYPHGQVATDYGILRSDGTSERALFLIDTQGILRYIDVHDINTRPPLEELVRAMKELSANEDTAAVP